MVRIMYTQTNFQVAFSANDEKLGAVKLTMKFEKTCQGKSFQWNQHSVSDELKAK